MSRPREEVLTAKLELVTAVLDAGDTDANDTAYWRSVEDETRRELELLDARRDLELLRLRLTRPPCHQ